MVVAAAASVVVAAVAGAVMAVVAAAVAVAIAEIAATVEIAATAGKFQPLAGGFPAPKSLPASFFSSDAVALPEPRRLAGVPAPLSPPRHGFATNSAARNFARSDGFETSYEENLLLRAVCSILSQYPARCGGLGFSPTAVCFPVLGIPGSDTGEPFGEHGHPMLATGRRKERAPFMAEHLMKKKSGPEIDSEEFSPANLETAIFMTTWQKRDWQQFYEIARRPWRRHRPPRPVYPSGLNRVAPAQGFSLSELDDAGVDLDLAERLGLPVDAGRIGVYGPNVSVLRDFIRSSKHGF